MCCWWSSFASDLPSLLPLPSQALSPPASLYSTIKCCCTIVSPCVLVSLLTEYRQRFTPQRWVEICPAYCIKIGTILSSHVFSEGDGRCVRQTLHEKSRGPVNLLLQMSTFNSSTMVSMTNCASKFSDFLEHTPIPHSALLNPLVPPLHPTCTSLHPLGWACSFH